MWNRANTWHNSFDALSRNWTGRGKNAHTIRYMHIKKLAPETVFATVFRYLFCFDSNVHVCKYVRAVCAIFLIALLRYFSVIFLNRVSLSAQCDCGWMSKSMCMKCRFISACFFFYSSWAATFLYFPTLFISRFFLSFSLVFREKFVKDIINRPQKKFIAF